MNAKKRRRLAFAAAVFVAGAVGAWVCHRARKTSAISIAQVILRPNMLHPASQYASAGSFKRRACNTIAVSECISSSPTAIIPVAYTGGLPGLFREGQGVVATGVLNQNGVFDATELLAKHDERYTPPEVVDALKRSGHWKEGG